MNVTPLSTWLHFPAPIFATPPNIPTYNAASSAALVLDLGGAVLAAGSAVQLTLTYSGVVGGAEAGVGLFASEPWVSGGRARG